FVIMVVEAAFNIDLSVLSVLSVLSFLSFLSVVSVHGAFKEPCIYSIHGTAVCVSSHFLEGGGNLPRRVRYWRFHLKTHLKRRSGGGGVQGCPLSVPTSCASTYLVGRRNLCVLSTLSPFGVWGFQSGMG
ncbi:hypothetical protein BZA05DRAFT_388825, partial [Tricharina praecox]|uniref:uncharacterized protein n=1 Tax=Tricharina praecox TaxID=43433 RepID=UPI00221EDB32